MREECTLDRGRKKEKKDSREVLIFVKGRRSNTKV